MDNITPNKARVLKRYPRSTARHYTITHDWEIFETEDTDRSRLLGSGVELKVSYDQDEEDYKSTENAAWDDAWRNLLALDRYRDLATSITREAMGSVTGRYPSEIDPGVVQVVARRILDEHVMEDFFSIADRLRSQDNGATSDPLFAVFNRVREFGFDPQYAEDDHITWLNSEEMAEADRKKQKALERYFNRFAVEPRHWSRTAWKLHDEFVTACFTKEAARDYIAFNHRLLEDPFVRAVSLVRNPEMKAIRDLLEGM